VNIGRFSVDEVAEAAAATVGAEGTLRTLDSLPQPSACAVAYKEYGRQSLFSTLFTIAVLALVIATVAFLVTMLAFLTWTILDWDDAVVINNAVKAVATLASAAGALVTGVAAKSVYDKKTDQDTLTAAAQRVVNKYCQATT
jgi:hypothetical protein